MQTLRLATRGSVLALAQTRWVAARLEALNPGLQVTWEVFRTTGDATQAAGTPMAAVGSKGLFTKELEEALLDGRADLAVHSLKDVPTELPPGLTLLATPEREDARDAILCRAAAGLAALPAGARVGTSSLRRMAQLRRRRPDLEFVPVRGNVDTRLRKLAEGQYDALVMAAAGLRRLGLEDRISEYLPPAVCLPAVGQGALALEGRADDAAVAALCAPLNDTAVAVCVAAERAFLRRLSEAGAVPEAPEPGAAGVAPPGGGSCQVPVAAHCEQREGGLRLRGLVAALDGSELVEGELTGAAPEPLGVALAERLLARGAERLIEQAHAAAAGAPAPADHGAGSLAADGAQPLAGHGVLVTRARAQAAAMLEAIGALGGRAFLFPAIRTVPPEDWQPLDAAVAQIERYAWLVLTSANAVEQFAARLRHAGRDAGALAPLRIAAVGAATARALQGARMKADLLPPTARGGALPAAMAPYLRPGDRVLMPRADLADPGLRQGLEALGCQVDDPVAYRTVPGDADPAPVRAALAAGEITYATFTSGSTVRNTLAALGGPAALAGVRIAVLGPETAREAAAAGLTVHVRAGGASAEALVAALAADAARVGGPSV